MLERCSDEMPTAHRSGKVQRRHLPGRSLLIMPIALLALSLFGVLAGCDVGAPSGATKTTQTATARAAQAATATRAAEPVWTSISVQQEGAIAANNASLNISVTVTNRTSAPIHISFACGFAPVIVQVIPVNGQGVLWAQDSYSCPPTTAQDDPHQIDRDVSYTFTYTAPLSQYGAEVGHGGFHVGEYQVIAKYTWHQGTIDQIEADPPSVLYGKATGETTISLR